MDAKEKTALQKEIVNSLPFNPHCRLILAPRIGKTKLVIDIIKKNKPKSILWVTKDDKLRIDIEQEFITWKAKKYLENLETVTWSSLNKVTGFKQMVVLDEEQYITPQNIINFLNGKFTYLNIVSMTGTESRTEEKLKLYEELELKVFYRLTISDASELGLLADYRIKAFGMPIKPDSRITKTIKHKKTKENVQIIVNEGVSYRRLSDLIKKRNYPFYLILQRIHLIKNSPTKLLMAKYLLSKLKGRKLIYCSNINQAELLSEYTYHSKTDSSALNMFMNGGIEELALVNSGGVGFTFRNVRHLIMVQTDSDENGLSSQKITRALLEQGDNYVAQIWIIYLKDTVDEKWVHSTLKSFDPNKIEYVNKKDLEYYEDKS